MIRVAKTFKQRKVKIKTFTIKIQFNGIYYHYIFVVICILKLESWKTVADDVREEIQ